MYKFLSPGNNITEVIRVKDKFNQLFQDKLFLVMLVLGLLTIVAAAGAITIQRGNTPGENPYMQMEEPGKLMAEETQEEKEPMIEIVEQTVGAGEEAGGTESSQTVQNSRKDAQTKGSEDPYVAAGTGKRRRNPAGTGFFRRQHLGVAGTGQYSAGLQHGHHHLFSNLRPVSVQSCCRDPGQYQ